jgi:membrane protease YdiL (CAAX protease family)
MSGVPLDGPVRRVIGTVAYGRDGRPRAVFRTVAPPLLMLVGLLGGSLVGAATLGESHHYYDLVYSLVGAVVFVPLLWVVARRLDGRSLAEFGLAPTRRWVVDALAGGCFALGATGVMLAVAVAFGTVRVTAVNSLLDSGMVVSILAVGLVGNVLVGLTEELAFRGGFLTNAAEGVHARGLSPRAALAVAWVVSSVAFALIHVPFIPDLSGGASVPVVVGSMAALGAVLGLAYVLTGSLALPVGIHAGWNFTSAHLVGTEAPTVVVTESTGTGLTHASGIPSLVAIVALLVATVGYTAVRTDSPSLQSLSEN